MRGFLSARRSPEAAPAGSDPAPAATWYEGVVATARDNGAFPYVVEGYAEIAEAVRRGHAVLLKREEATVADGITVFADTDAAPSIAPGSEVGGFLRRVGASLVVTVARFDVRTARYHVQDSMGTVGSLELTPKRLERYVAAPERSVGVALG